MPAKKNKGKGAEKGEDPKKPPAFQKSALMCSGAQAPGPKYKLNPLVGYKDHCVSRNRNPAYSIAARQTGQLYSDGPGPIYYPQPPKTWGFTIGGLRRGGSTECGPGPYLLPDPPRTPAFSLRWRTPLRGVTTSAGPYNLPSGLNGPAFTIATRPEGIIGAGGPGPSPPYSIDPVKPRAPAYSLAFRQNDAGLCAGPGPYNPVDLDKSPAYSFGAKHSPCAPPYITEHDEVC